MATDDVADLRREYSDRGLTEGDLAADPITMFAGWFDEVRAAGLYEPNAMVVSTVSGEGQPSSRMVLLKGFSETGFVFFTNQASRKGVELAAEPRCALLFPWHPLERQVRVDGTAELLPREAVDAYFAVRPRGSQLGAWASRQGSVIEGREGLVARAAELDAEFGDVVPRPEFWGGYRLRPDIVEFWEGRPNRLHDRAHFVREPAGGWRSERLSP